MGVSTVSVPDPPMTTEDANVRYMRRSQVRVGLYTASVTVLILAIALSERPPFWLLAANLFASAVTVLWGALDMWQLERRLRRHQSTRADRS